MSHGGRNRFHQPPDPPESILQIPDNRRNHFMHPLLESPL